MTEPVADDLPKPKWTWRGFWARFKSKDLDGADDDALFLRIFIPFASFSGVAMILIDVECTADDWMKNFTSIYMWLPITVLGWLLAYRTRAWRKHWGERLWLVIAPMLYGVAGYLCLRRLSDVGQCALGRRTDTGGRLTEKWHPNGINSQYEWNADNSLASLDNRVALSGPQRNSTLNLRFHRP